MLAASPGPGARGGAGCHRFVPRRTGARDGQPVTELGLVNGVTQPGRFGVHGCDEVAGRRQITAQPGGPPVHPGQPAQAAA